MARRRGRNPGSVTSIGNNAFAFCNNLTGIVIPAGVTDIAEGTFYFCSSLSDVTIPGSVSSIGDRAFDNCSTLTGIIISQAVTRIGNYAFGNCSSLRGITVAAANPAYSSEAGILFDKAKTALLQCPGGRPGTYAVPEGVTTIGPSAFASCRDRTGITLPDSLHGIGPGAFGSCSRLFEITIPPKVSSIELQAFAFCASLMDITVHPANRSYSSAGGVLFQEDEGTAELQCFPGGKAGHYRIPHGVTSILPHAFLECPNLTGLTIPAIVPDDKYLCKTTRTCRISAWLARFAFCHLIPSNSGNFKP